MALNSRLNSKFIQILIHIIAWGVFLMLLDSLVPKPQKMDPALSKLMPDLFFILFFYFNFYYVVPRFFITKKYWSFSIICLGCLFLTVAVPSLLFDISGTRPPLHQFAERPPSDLFQPPDGFPMMGGEHAGLTFFRPEFAYSVFVFILVFTISLGIRMYIQWQTAEREKIKTELSFLKAQINPHFLFNTLNNIYSMAINKNENTPDAIEKFSEIMRFVIFETQNDFIPLSKKLTYIRNYLALQKMRLPSNVLINFSLKGNVSTYKIAPLTLLPFIENAFKYGISTEKKAVINIEIEIIGGELYLLVQNEKFNRIKKSKEVTPLGINNTKKRLELLYPGKHKIKIVDGINNYQVSLYLNLND